jgi:hypothetical protein
MLHRAPFLTAIAFSLYAAACTQSEADACGEGTVYRDGDCHPAPASSAGTSSMSDGGAGNEPGAGGASEASDPNFGVDCTASDECMGATDYCIPMSPFDTAYCSASGCDLDASICPSGWKCTDLSQFLTDAPWACSRPFPTK